MRRAASTPETGQRSRTAPVLHHIVLSPNDVTELSPQILRGRLAWGTSPIVVSTPPRDKNVVPSTVALQRRYRATPRALLGSYEEIGAERASMQLAQLLHSQHPSVIPLLKGALRCMKNTLLARAWRTWVAESILNAWELGLLEADATPLLKHRQRHYIKSWIRYSVKAKSRTVLLACVGRHMHRAARIPYWETWRAYSERRSLLSYDVGCKVTLATKLRLLNALQAWRGGKAWRAALDERTTQRRLLSSRISCTRAIALWIHNGRRNAKIKAAAALTWDNLIRQQRMADSWQSWQTWCIALLRTQASIRRCLYRLVVLRVRHSWLAWKMIAAANGLHLRQLHKATADMHCAQTASAFFTWQKAALQAASQLERLHRAIGFVLNTRGAGAFATWTQAARQSTANAVANLRAVKHLFDKCNTQVAMAFATWMQASRQSAVNTVASLHATKYLLDKRVKRCWDAWELAWTDAARAWCFASNCMFQMEMRQLTRSWHAWLLVVAERSVHLQFIRIGTRMSLNALASTTLACLNALATWRQAAVARQLLLQKGARFMQNAQRAAALTIWKEATMSGVAASLLMHKHRTLVLALHLSRSWVVWCWMAAERAADTQLQAVSGCFLMRQHLVLLAASLASWSAASAWQKRWYLHEKKSRAFALHSQLASAFAMWLSHLDCLGSRRMWEVTTSYMASHNLSRSLARWQQHYRVTGCEQVSLLRSIVTRLQMRLRRGWMHLSTYATVQMSLEDCLRRTQCISLERSCRRWMAMMSNRSQHNGQLYQATTFMLGAHVTHAFNTWREANRRHSALSDAKAKMAHSWVSRCLVLGWQSWQVTWRSGAHARQSMQSCFRHLMTCSWKVWAAMAAERSRRLQQLCKDTHIMLSSQLSLAFATIGHAGEPLASGHLLRGWLVWRAMFRGVVRSRYLFRRCGTRLLKRRLPGTLRAWAAAVSEQRLRAKQFSESASCMLTVRSAITFAKWKAMGSQRMGQLQRLWRGVLFMNIKKTATAILTWKHAALDVHVWKCTWGEAASLALHTRRTFALHTWRQLAREIKIRRAMWCVARRTASCLCNQHVARSWVAWHALWCTEAHARHMREECVRFVLNAQVVKSFKRWKYAAAETSHRLQHSRMGVNFMLNAQATAAFATWQHTAMQASDQLQQLRRGVSFMLNAQAATAFVAWKQAAEQTATAKDTLSAMRQVAAYLCSQRLARCWLAWHALWCTQSHLRGLLRQRVNCMLKGQLTHSWNAWASMASERSTCLQQLRRGVSFMLNAQTATAFATWRQTAEQSAAQKAIISVATRAATSMCSQHVARSWVAWHTLWCTRLYARRMRDERVIFMLDAQVVKRFTRWRYAAAKRSCQVQQLRRGVSFMLNAQTTAAFATWWYNRVEASYELQQLRKGVSFMRDTRASAALATWKVAASMGAQAAKSAQAFTTQALLHGWNSWHAAWLESVHAEYTRCRSLQRLLNLQLTHSWNAWASMASERRVCLQQLRKGASFMSNQRTDTAFATWYYAAVQESRQQQTNKGVTFILNARRVTAFSTWRQAAERTAAGRTTLCVAARAATCLCKQHVVCSWVAWHALWCTRAHARRVQDGCVRFMLHAQIVKGLTRWKYAAAEASEQLQQLRRGVSFMLNAQAATAFATWQHAALQASEQLQQLWKGASFMLNAKAAAAFASWLQLLCRLSAEESLATAARRAATYLHNRHLVHGWLSWRAIWRALVGTQFVTQRCLTHMTKRELSKSWRAWETRVAERITRQRQCLKRLIHHQLAGRWSTWAARATECRNHAQQHQIGDDFVMAFAFATWRQTAGESALREEVTVSYVMGYLHSRCFAKAWSIWYVHRTNGLEKSALMRRGVSWHHSSALACVWHAWLRVIVAGWKHTLLDCSSFTMSYRKAFSAWLDYAVRVAKAQVLHSLVTRLQITLAIMRLSSIWHDWRRLTRPRNGRRDSNRVPEGDAASLEGDWSISESDTLALDNPLAPHMPQSYRTRRANSTFERHQTNKLIRARSMSMNLFRLRSGSQSRITLNRLPP